jgi:hypothetical protein
MTITTKGRYHVGTIVLGKSTKLEVNVVRHIDDKDYIDVRTWFSNMYAGGAWTPTKKGIHVPLKAIPELREFLKVALTFDPKDLVPDDAPISE